jgi:hypothetical protein
MRKRPYNLGIEKARVQLSITMIWEYILKIEQRYANEIILLENNMLVRGADDLHNLNIIQSKARLEAVRDVCADIQKIMQMNNRGGQ